MPRAVLGGFSPYGVPSKSALFLCTYMALTVLGEVLVPGVIYIGFDMSAMLSNSSPQT